ncbi:MAG: serine hydrolase domain-containing protein [Bdellovibrionota bacterium]
MPGVSPFEWIIQEGFSQKLFPGCAASVILRGEVARRVCVGKLGYDEHGGPWGEVTPETVYDLASLTKPLAGAVLSGIFLEQKKLALDEPVKRKLPELEGSAQGEVTLRQLLSHSAGYPAWRPVYEKRFDGCHYLPRGVLLSLAIAEPLEARPGEKACYSDLGYMLLTALLERVGSTRMDAAFTLRVASALSLKRTFFIPLPRDDQALPVPLKEIAPTSICPWRGRLLHGEVEDDNAWALSGVAAQAGLFSSLSDLENLFLHLRRIYRGEPGLLRPETLALLWKKEDVPQGTTWALGWDTPNPVGSHTPSSAGERFSRRAVGALGFTGTSLWYDLDRDLAVLCLSNRVHPCRETADLKRFRPALHDVAVEEFGR